MSIDDRIRVLLVDDDPEICWGIGKILSRKGYKVTICGDGIDAKHLLQEEQFDFMITDIQMPNLNGLTLLEWIRKELPFLNVIVITGYGAPALKNMIIGKGAILYLEKPVDPYLLSQILKDKSDEQKNQSFSGMTSDIELIDYIQFLLGTRKNSILEVVSANNEKGVIYFKQGNIPHVLMGELQGEEAFYYIVSEFSGGKFNSLDYQSPEVTTIDKPGEYLLMEACRIKDEGFHKQEFIADDKTMETESSEEQEEKLFDMEDMDEFDFNFPE